MPHVPTPRPLPGPAQPASPQDQPPRPLFVCSDELLLEDLLRLAAAAGVEPVVAADAAAARAGWSAATVVLVADQMSGQIEAAGLPRRDGVALVSRNLDNARVWEQAVRIGAQSVALLPEAQPWLVDALAATGRPAGTVVGVLGGRGGAGSSSLACALSLAAVRSGLRTVLVDADPLGGGLDLVLGGQDVPGLRWSDAVRAATTALPAVSSLLVLSWDSGEVLDLAAQAMESVLRSAVSGADLVVVDLPRRLDAASRVALERATRTYLVVPAEVRAVVSAGRVAALVGALTGSVQIVVRGPAPSGLTAQVVAEALGLPLAGYCAPEPGLAESLERGDPPGGHPGPLATLARQLVAGLAVRARKPG